MESATSKTLTHGQNPSRVNVVDRYEDAIALSFRSLGLTDEHGSNDTNSSRIKNQRSRAARQSSVRTQWFSGNSVSDHDSIWGYRFFDHGGDSFGTTECSVSNTHNYEHDSFSHEARDIPNYHRFREIENNGPYSGNRCDIITNNGLNCNCWWNQNVAEAGPVTDLTIIRNILKGEQCLQKERLIHALQSFVVTLMTDEKMHSIFQALVDASEGKNLDSLVETIFWESESFINASFCKQGVNSIAKLIRKLKKSHHAFTVTRILSTKFVDLMTDRTARQVIQTCFILFGHEPNKILYEGTINHCHYLAIHKVGCRALNDCISTISGQQRSRLLDNIAGIADILCDNLYGNYVLQNVMELNHSDVNARIFDCLRGKFIQLAKRKVGSHTVEKCMEISQTLLLSVIEEILYSPRAPQVLAQHNFGNYVVQKALLMTRKHGLIDLYNCLVNSLLPHFSALMQTTGGRNVIDVIKE